MEGDERGKPTTSWRVPPSLLWRRRGWRNKGAEKKINRLSPHPCLWEPNTADLKTTYVVSSHCTRQYISYADETNSEWTQNRNNRKPELVVNWDSSVGWATTLRIGWLRFDSRHWHENFLSSKTSTTQPPIHCVQGALSSDIKRPGREADHSPPSSAEVKNGGAIPPLLRMPSWHSV
jgi:hypothetical protein